MAVPYICAKCGASFSAGSGPQCSFCGTNRETGESWPWLAAQEWFVLVAAVVAGVFAFISS